MNYMNFKCKINKNNKLECLEDYQGLNKGDRKLSDLGTQNEWNFFNLVEDDLRDSLENAKKMKFSDSFFDKFNSRKNLKFNSKYFE